MQHAEGARGPRIADHGASIVLGVPGVNDKRFIQLRCQSDLRGERRPLGIARRIVIVVVESAFTDRDCGIAKQFTKACHIAPGNKCRSVVGMDPGSGKDESGVRRRDISGGGSRRERLADTDDRSRARIAGAIDYVVAVAVERRVREVGVAVDED